MEKIIKELKIIEDGLRSVAITLQNTLSEINDQLNDYADLLEYYGREKEIEHSLNYAIKNGYLDDEGLETPQQKLKAWKKLEVDSIRAEMLHEDECGCEPDKMCENCKEAEENQ